MVWMMCVKFIKSAVTSQLPVRRGVPQGTVLGPLLLFTLKMLLELQYVDIVTN